MFQNIDEEIDPGPEMEEDQTSPRALEHQVTV